MSSGVFFHNVAIIGGGLMGTSLALALREGGLCERLFMVDRDDSVLRVLEDMDMDCHVSSSPSSVVGDCDIVVLAVPVGCYGEVLRDCASHFKAGALVSDVGSVKACVMKDMAACLPTHVSYVPSHPLAGTEHSGPLKARHDLYHGKTCVVTPVSLDSVGDGERQTMALWEALGMDVVLMEAEAHDALLAFSSHLPHVIAFALTMCIRERGEKAGHDIEKVSGGGLKDFTRIAASDAVMWRDIFMANKDNLCEALRDFSTSLASLSQMIEKGDRHAIESTLSSLRQFKRFMGETKTFQKDT